MFCIKCGAENLDEAIFCTKCGFKFEAKERAQPKINIEEKIFSIRPTLMFIQAGYAAAVAGAFLLVVVLYYLGQMLGFPIPWWLSVFGGFALLLIPAFFHFRRNMVRYTLTDARIEIDEGFISRETRKVPLRAIQDVTVQASIPQRFLGLGSLIIDNANESDEKIILKNINSPKNYADQLLAQMRTLDK